MCASATYLEVNQLVIYTKYWWGGGGGGNHGKTSTGSIRKTNKLAIVQLANCGQSPSSFLFSELGNHWVSETFHQWAASGQRPESIDRHQVDNGLWCSGQQICGSTVFFDYGQPVCIVYCISHSHCQDGRQSAGPWRRNTRLAFSTREFYPLLHYN